MLKGIKGHVRIFSSITAIAEYSPLLSHFLTLYNDVNIDFREYPSPKLYVLLLREN